MVFAPHLSLYVVVLVFIMICTGFPTMGSTWLLLLVDEVCIGFFVVGLDCGLLVGFVRIVVRLVRGLP